MLDPWIREQVEKQEREDRKRRGPEEQPVLDLPENDEPDTDRDTNRPDNPEPRVIIIDSGE